MSDDFFEDPTEENLVKTTIVAKYFRVWSRVLLQQTKPTKAKLAYIDLFAGPGQFYDGAKSTPLLILEIAIADEDLQQRLITVFNDKDPKNVARLREAIAQLPGIEKLRSKPAIFDLEVGPELANELAKLQLSPTLLFADPWGYKGLSRNLLDSVLRRWGSDCIFFFNYRRINAALENDYFRGHMDMLFGSDRVNRLRNVLPDLSPDERELTIIEALVTALRETYGRYVIPFRFRTPEGTRTSHHLVFVSKHERGYEIMKEIMAKESSTADQGVPSFEYNRATDRQTLLFEFYRPLDDLKELLLTEFAGQRLSMLDIYRRHHIDRRFIKANYKQILRDMESNRQIKAEPPASKRPLSKGAVTFSDTVMVTFPSKEA